MPDVEAIQSHLKRALSSADDLGIVTAIVGVLRPPRRSDEASATLDALVALLRQDDGLRAEVAAPVRRAVRQLSLVRVLVESGILTDKGMFAGVRDLVGARLAPPVHAPNDLRVALGEVFTDAEDWRWVTSVPAAKWQALFECFVVEEDSLGLLHADVATAIKALAQRIGAAGIDDDMSAKHRKVWSKDSPFLALTVQVHEFIEDHRDGTGSRPTAEALLAGLDECRSIVLHVRANKHVHGTSVRLTSVTRRLLQQIDRLELLVHLVRPAGRSDLARSLAALSADIIKANQTSRSLARHIAHSVDLWAYQITEHAADKGEKYVGRSSQDYWRYLRGAMGGGALVAIFAVLKLFLSKLELPLGVQSFVYGLNYAVCFCLIYATGSILATKQPALTAPAIARSIDEAATRRDALDGVAETIMLVWRSQFVSFVGNIACAFPIAIAIAWGLEYLLGIEAASVEKSRALLHANHPWDSGALLFAAIAGVFLFVAGLVQGAVENQVAYTGLRQRLEQHPRLAFLGRRRDQLVRLLTENAGGLVGNIVLGFMLGSAGTVGVIFGLPLDIRHIAFSSSHVGVATLDAPQLMVLSEVREVVLGIVGIGFVNFLVSFGLTLAVTFKSRRIPFSQGGALLVKLALLALRRPHHWFLPLGGYDQIHAEAEPQPE